MERQRDRNTHMTHVCMCVREKKRDRGGENIKKAKTNLKQPQN